jgi:hypothetical protein
LQHQQVLLTGQCQQHAARVVGDNFCTLLEKNKTFTHEYS